MFTKQSWALAIALCGLTAVAAEPVKLKSAGALAFGPEGTLFIGDAAASAIYAVETGDKSGTPAEINLPNLDEKLGGMMGTMAKNVVIGDIAVNPASGNVYLSVANGRTPDATVAIFRTDAKGGLSELNLASVKTSRANLNSVPTGNRQAQAITGLRYVDGRVIVAGLSNEEFASTLRSIPYPFEANATASGLEIYHAAHGRLETASPIRTFMALQIGGQSHILAAYTCTPLVKIPVADLKPGAKVRGTTVAELGNRNVPLDMIEYTKDGKRYVLIANSSRGVMKVDASGIEKAEGLDKPVKGGGTAGLPYTTVAELKGVVQLDKLDANRAVILVKGEASVDLKTIALP